MVKRKHQKTFQLNLSLNFLVSSGCFFYLEEKTFFNYYIFSRKEGIHLGILSISILEVNKHHLRKGTYECLFMRKHEFLRKILNVCYYR